MKNRNWLSDSVTDKKTLEYYEEWSEAIAADQVREKYFNLGQQASREEIAKNLLQMGWNFNNISNVTKLSEKDIKSIFFTK